MTNAFVPQQKLEQRNIQDSAHARISGSALPVTRDQASLTKRMFQFSESVLTSMMPSEKQSMAPMRPVVWLRNLSVSSFCKGILLQDLPG